MLGMHDFRNFCKKDDSMAQDDEDGQQNFERRIYKFDVRLESQSQIKNEFSLCVAQIRGSAFLWH